MMEKKRKGNCMNVGVDVSYKSLNKYHEELCGDKVEILKAQGSNIVILADGMGSGVKANILATLTSKILGTMFLNGADLKECVETIVKTLPVCQVRQIAYSTFSILQIFENGEGYLVEFDNPRCVFIRDGMLLNFPFKERILEGKTIKEYRFKVQVNDNLILMSDGVIHAGVGKILNFGWTWDNMAEYAVQSTKKAVSSKRMAYLLSKACDDLYMGCPGDDTTVAVTKIIHNKEVHILTGPASNQIDDERMVGEFMEGKGKKIICGGTSANIIAKILGRELVTSFHYADPELPPIAHIEGIDIVTEGVLTLSRALTLLRRYEQEEIDEEFFLELDSENGGSLVAKAIIENCTDLKIYVGKAINVAHQNPNLPVDISIRMNLVGQIKELVKKIGKKVTVIYY
jgi:hypothetical protein